MSTYLVAFIISEYDYLENNDSGKIIQIHAPKNKVKDGQFALEVATKSLHFYSSYFKIPYPLPKIDLVSVEDFSFRAMENWGLITFVENAVLASPENSSTIVKQQNALTICHEMAHQWFGNLVTMEWWTDLWLNEGYASFMEHLCVDNLYPQYKIWTQFLITRYTRALDLDALANTHPIEVPIENPSEITEIFDEISYSKGASIIRMIHNFIGDENFRAGMTLYLNKNSYSNVTTEDLWIALEKSSNKPIKNVMSSWTNQAGFPLITISEKVSNSTNSRILTLSQERFIINDSDDFTSATWMVPITLTSGQNPDEILEKLILDQKTKEVELKNISKNTWIKINVGSIGFYRTLYSNDLLESLMSGIQNKSLPTFDRLNLLDDLFACAQAGKISTVSVLKTLKDFEDETDYVIWSCIIKNLKKINIILKHSEDTYLKFKAFGNKLLSKVHNKLGWVPSEKETHLYGLTRFE